MIIKIDQHSRITTVNVLIRILLVIFSDVIAHIHTCDWNHTCHIISDL